jgi:uncharacterized protein YbcI
VEILINKRRKVETKEEGKDYKQEYYRSNKFKILIKDNKKCMEQIIGIKLIPSHT